VKGKWYYVGIKFEDGLRKYICQVNGSLEKSVFSKKENSFIKLKRVRWLRHKKKSNRTLVVKLENATNGGFTDCVYVRKNLIDSIWPLKNLSIFNV